MDRQTGPAGEDLPKNVLKNRGYEDIIILLGIFCNPFSQNQIEKAKQPLKMLRIILLNLVIFISAFLLFQIEPIISKIFLPVFGGSYLVWGACVVFFQAALLAGYYYSHKVVKIIGIRRYRLLHLVLLFLPLFVFPGRPLPPIVANYRIPMPIEVFLQLFISIGLVFFVLSTTSIILQSWLASSGLRQRENPYLLYAASNLGSFLALLSYPFFFELFFGLKDQLAIWRAGYLVFLVLHLFIFKFVDIPAQDELRTQGGGVARVGFAERLRWFFLGSAGVIMFLSVTNIATYEIAPIPLLWVIPLCIYLLSFVLNFKQNPWYPAWIRENFHLIAGFSATLYFVTQKGIIGFAWELLAHLVFLFLICMFCQGELYRHKPKAQENLTDFYLAISLGGFFGGVIVSWIIPLVSVSMVEYLVGLSFIALALNIKEKRSPLGPYNLRLLIYLALILVLWPLNFNSYNFFALVLLFLVIKFIYAQMKSSPGAFFLSFLIILMVGFLGESFWASRQYTYQRRNYYGVYKVFERSGKRMLRHGSIVHGAQYLSEKKQNIPLTYYHYNTPVGELLSSSLFNIRKVAVIGLGAGTLSVYGGQERNFDFFEIDPDVYYIANRYFTYLKKSRAKMNFVFGDARLSLAGASGGDYDLMVIDAFSGDSIPVHLLTIEAISLYKKSLSKEGIILFHVSNNYLKLEPVLSKNAWYLGAYACTLANKGGVQKDIYSSTWVAFSWNKEIYDRLITKLKWKEVIPEAACGGFRAWSDDYSSVSSVLSLHNLASDIKDFRPFYW